MAYRSRKRKSASRRSYGTARRSSRPRVRAGSGGRRRLRAAGSARSQTLRLVIEQASTSPAMAVPASLGGGFAVQGEAPKKNPTF